MVNGNYVLYGDRSCSESEIVDDHVQTRTTERKIKRKPNRSASELQHSLNLAKLDNETDSVKYEKKINEPRLLRYVPTTDVEENYVSDKFETYDLRASEELPRRHNYTKKPKNPSDGSQHYCNSRSSSSCSSPNGNLPTISEQCEQYGTYRIRAIQAPPMGHMGYENKLDKYFAKPKEVKSFTAKVGYNGSHPDSLYRVAADGNLGDSKTSRLLRMLRWPLALFTICVALGVFVFFLMPVNLGKDLDSANATNWEDSITGAQSHSILNQLVNKATTDAQETKRNPTPGQNTPEIDFYEADADKTYDTTDTITEINLKRKLPAPPVFPRFIAPEVQYGNEKADTGKLRTPKLLEETRNALFGDSTFKPHITQKPEKPLAIYFRDGTTITAASTDATAITESFANAESSNGLTGFVDRDSDNAAADISKHQIFNYNEPPGLVSDNNDGKLKLPIIVEPEISDTVQELYSSPEINSNIKFTSGHSKFFGISMEHAQDMKSTTQHSLYNTRVSPTLPTWRDRDDATTKKYPVNNNPDVQQCRSTHLPLCRGILPYDLAGPSVTNGLEDLSAYLPQIEYLVNTNCSDRIRHFACALLEPECSPHPYPQKLPCYNFCKAIVDSCEGSIPKELRGMMKCDQYSSNNCVNARTPCFMRELACGDGSCVPRDWVCDGTKDCPGGEDEAPCDTCELNEFRCTSGTCIEKRWLCDGYTDCPSGEDEEEDLCRGKHPRREYHAGADEPGEELAGSAPEPSVRKPNRLPHPQGRRSGYQLTGDIENSKELLMTSDSNNGFMRNYTRRPSPSRLTPYKRRKMNANTETEPSSMATTTVSSSRGSYPDTHRRTTRPRSKPVTSRAVETKTESAEDIIGDLGFFEDPKEKIDGPEEKTRVSKKNEQVLNSESTTPSSARFDKLTNKLERYIDGATMLRKAAQEDDTTDTPDSPDSPEVNITAGTGEWGAASAHASPCPAGELRCVDGRCITLAQLCDGAIDCSDHADEDNCFT